MEEFHSTTKPRPRNSAMAKATSSSVWQALAAAGEGDLEGARRGHTRKRSSGCERSRTCQEDRRHGEEEKWEGSAEPQVPRAARRRQTSSEGRKGELEKSMEVLGREGQADETEGGRGRERRREALLWRPRRRKVSELIERAELLPEHLIWKQEWPQPREEA